MVSASERRSTAARQAVPCRADISRLSRVAIRHCRTPVRLDQLDHGSMNPHGRITGGFSPLLTAPSALATFARVRARAGRSEEHTSELQSRQYLVCRLLLEKKKKHI